MAAAGAVKVYQGSIAGAQYRIEVPDRWNGTLPLWSHGLYPAGFLPEEIQHTNQPATKAWLLDHGYATAASNHRTPTGWSVREALDDQITLLDWFAGHIGRPRRVISAGSSMGGLIAVLALAGSLSAIPGWSRAFESRPREVASQVRQQADWLSLFLLEISWGSARADLEQRAGGDPTWNVGVDYRRQLARSSERHLVRQAYREAGISLGADLDRLAKTPRVRPDPGRPHSWPRYGTPRGVTPWPVLTLHTLGDGGVAVEHERLRRPRAARSARWREVRSRWSPAERQRKGASCEDPRCTCHHHRAFRPGDGRVLGHLVLPQPHHEPAASRDVPRRRP